MTSKRTRYPATNPRRTRPERPVFPWNLTLDGESCRFFMTIYATSWPEAKRKAKAICKEQEVKFVKLTDDRPHVPGWLALPRVTRKWTAPYIALEYWAANEVLDTARITIRAIDFMVSGDHRATRPMDPHALPKGAENLPMDAA